MNRSLCWLLRDAHSQLYVGENRKQGQECLLAAFPSLRVSADFFFFFCLCLCHLIFKPGFDLLCLCKSGESLQTDIKWACACFGMLLLLSTCPDILQQMGAGILKAHLCLPSYPPSRSAGAPIRCLFSRQSAERRQVNGEEKKQLRSLAIYIRSSCSHPLFPYIIYLASAIKTHYLRRR